ncbi:MAG TPA: NBR1-Ig-like domain-containing protein [Anaerolineales bacterium]|nr:NBR1-Ig-like domain-containing protein [Anaerolineales bacterium]
MQTRKTKKLIFWLTALMLIMACAPALATPLPPIDPNAVGTYIAQTANAAFSQTAAAMPTSTPTITFTPTPRNTDTPEPTPTNTVIFIFSSPTPVRLFTPTVAISNQNFDCQLISVSPVNGTAFEPRANFDAVWNVKNIGKRDWERDSVDYVYASGDKFHEVEGYDLSKTVKVGEIIGLIVDMEAPKNPGTYTTRWTMRVGSQEFCPLSLTIIVR